MGIEKINFPRYRKSKTEPIKPKGPLGKILSRFVVVPAPVLRGLSLGREETLETLATPRPRFPAALLCSARRRKLWAPRRTLLPAASASVPSAPPRSSYLPPPPTENSSKISPLPSPTLSHSAPTAAATIFSTLGF